MRLEKIREKLEETDEGFFCLDCGEMIMTQEQVEEDGTFCDYREPKSRFTDGEEADFRRCDAR